MLQRLLIAAASLVLGACSAEKDSHASRPPDETAGTATTAEENTVKPDPANKPAAKDVATFGAGCYWCIEAVLEQLDGVLSVESGFMGGTVQNPSYEQVCSGTTGHAEVVRVEFDPARISYKKLLIWFFKAHDPTTLNRQGNDVGTQYRSVIFYHSEAQRAAAENAKKTINEARAYPDPVVTEITAAAKFYPAKSDHQDFYRRNRNHGYCQAIIAPKLDKLGLDK